jgi:hypothetical protein
MGLSNIATLVPASGLNLATLKPGSTVQREPSCGKPVALEE